MRRTCFFILVVMLLPICGGGYNEIDSRETGGNGSHSFCTEGKTWNYILFNVENEDLPEVPYSYVVRGDTIVDDIAYKKVYYQKNNTDSLAFMMRERESKVYKLYPNKEEFLFFDFGRADVGLVHHWTSEEGSEITNWMIYAIDAIQVDSNIFRRYCCCQQYSKTELNTIDEEYAQKDYWVEGIGSARYGIEADGLELSVRLPGISEYFVSCYDNGECVFTAEDFMKLSYTTDVKKVMSNVLRDETFYDLQGHKLQRAPQRGAYILGGKKYIFHEHDGKGYAEKVNVK